MKRNLVVAISTLAAILVLAQGARPDAPTLTKAEIQRVVQIISGNKTKTQQYCDIGKLNQRMAQADESDTEMLEALDKQVDDIVQQIGPEFVKFLDALDQIDPNSSEGKELIAALETLDKLCTTTL